MHSLKSLFGKRSKLLGIGLACGCLALIGSVSIAGPASVKTAWSTAYRTASHFVSPPSWRDILAESTAHHNWPWQTNAGQKIAAATPVRRLGFSATFAAAPADATKLAAFTARFKAPTVQPIVDRKHGIAKPSAVPVDDVAVGDQITVVTPDGLSHIYRVTAREDAQSGTVATHGKAAQTSCDSLRGLVAGAYRLVIEAVQIDSQHNATSEQKL